MFGLFVGVGGLVFGLGWVFRCLSVGFVFEGWACVGCLVGVGFLFGLGVDCVWGWVFVLGVDLGLCYWFGIGGLFYVGCGFLSSCGWGELDVFVGLDGFL